MKQLQLYTMTSPAKMSVQNKLHKDYSVPFKNQEKLKVHLKIYDQLYCYLSYEKY